MMEEKEWNRTNAVKGERGSQGCQDVETEFEDSDDSWWAESMTRKMNDQFAEASSFSNEAKNRSALEESID